MTHELHMKRAIALARSVDLSRDINPRVGAIVVNANGDVVGEGVHHGSGTAHAEMVAVQQAGTSAKGSTVYVTLEPCNSTGMQGPCSVGLIEAGVARVVYGQTDPHRAMAGGAEQLRNAGIDVISHIELHDCEALNSTWNFAQLNGRPWVTWKTATSLDGFIAAVDGTSKWITGDLAREQVQNLRAHVGAIVTGTGTVLADNPALTVRANSADQQPLRIVVGSRTIPADFQVMQGDRPAILMDADLNHALRTLWHEYKIHSVMLEAGAGLSSSAWKLGLIDEVYWFQAPVIMGTGIPALADIGVSTIQDARRFNDASVDRVGLDLVIHFTTR